MKQNTWRYKTMTQMPEDEIRKIAQERVKAKKGFYSHLTAYVLVNLMLVAIWYFTGAHYFWPMWVMLFWGIGVIVNAITVFARHDTGWEKREIEKEVERIKRRGG
jgi:uncharacterized membrane protein